MATVAFPVAFLVWRREEWDGILGFTLMTLGGLLILIGHPLPSGSPLVVDRVSYLMSGGITGLFLTHLHGGWRKLGRVEAHLRPGPETPDG